MISFQQAIQLIHENTGLHASETIKVSEAIGRIVSQPIASPICVPNFNNAAMDGYAVNACDLKKATQQNPITLKLAGISAAGDAYKESTKINQPNDTHKTAWKIMTGAPVPQGYDSIIPIERTQIVDDQVDCFYAAQKSDHIRLAGSDFSLNEMITQPGEKITPHHIMALASLGISQLTVYKKPSIALISTGKELTDNPQKPLSPGQIYNSNKPYMLSWLTSLPVSINDLGTNSDDELLFKQSLQKELEKNTNIIISSGAVSMGDFDFIPKLIKELGGDIIFHKAKIKPGKPILFARFNNGTLYFGLPGNPISSAIGLRFFVMAALRKIFGMAEEQPQKVLLSKAYNKTNEFRLFLKAESYHDETKQWVNILEGQESYKIKPLLKTNSWLVLKEGKALVDKLDIVESYPCLPSL